MARATPPRPLDITALFPELREHSTTATRLHPRPGAPTVADSSVGGPLLWPADDLDLDDLIEEPIPLIPVAQLYRRDIPDYAGPDGTDLLQVLWCPLDHSDRHYSPRVFLYWRDSSTVGPLLDAPPEPAVISDMYLPVPCVVHPEQVREYQYADLLPDDLRERLDEWDDDEDEDRPGYRNDLSLAPGWKVGGARWRRARTRPRTPSACRSGAATRSTPSAAPNPSTIRRPPPCSDAVSVAAGSLRVPWPHVDEPCQEFGEGARFLCREPGQSLGHAFSTPLIDAGDELPARRGETDQHVSRVARRRLPLDVPLADQLGGQPAGARPVHPDRVGDLRDRYSRAEAVKGIEVAIAGGVRGRCRGGIALRGPALKVSSLVVTSDPDEGRGDDLIRSAPVRCHVDDATTVVT
ncbi:hypothetical protein ACTI_44280 [Actinoplanes sp. OR16]|nr:hypothetical protein [Actinoplanes sp. OR16]BBH67743.1 hypothetical protein ACTI_44280 [Actinoplanes sp. OR16]